ncbi:MAG: glycosyltransferase [Deltaproteobacteria bacterium]|nr:glycosyltransferase [Deltaproteobacteria bacterium]MBT6492602.1 glycosyltransferase [Deltaproteobacteria bacterium]
MKIGIYTVSLFRQVTGIEKVGLQVAKALTADGHTVTWVAPPGQFAPIAALPAGVSVEHIPYEISLDHAAQLRDIVKRRELDVIVAMTTNGVASTFPVALDGLNTALVFSEHNQPDFYVEKWWGFGQDFEEKMRMRNAVIDSSDKVHVLRESCIPQGLTDANKVRVIPNATAKTNLRAQEPSQGQRNRFISIGRLSPEKGLLDGLEAFAKVSSRIPNWDYVFFGEGPLLDKLKERSKQLRILGRVQFRGHTDNPIQELSASQILLMPSKFEGWPLVAGEAQSVGLPILGYRDCEALAQCFDHPNGGHLVNERATDEMVQAMLEVATQTAKWRELSQNGLNSVKSREPKLIAQQWIQLIKEAYDSKQEHQLLLEKPIKSGASVQNPDAIDYLRHKIQQHVSSLPDEVGPDTLQAHTKTVFQFVARGRVKTAAQSVRANIWPIIRNALKEPTRMTASRLDGPNITLYSLPSIEDGPRHLAKHLQSPPCVIFDDPKRGLGVENYLKLLTSKVVVTEGGIPSGYQTHQKLVQIWHSTGFIKKGANLKSQLTESEFKKRSGDFTHVIAPSAEMIPMYAEAFCVPPSRVLPLGSIKTDFLIDPEQKSIFARQLISQIPSLTGKRIYVFAPTFRGQWPDCVFHYSSINLDEINEALADDERLIINLHPSLAATPMNERTRRTNLVPQPKHHKIIDAHAQNLTIQTLLAAADIFISDYSGGLLDAIAAQTPTICFADDLDHYRNQLTPGFIDEVPNLVTKPGSASFLDALKSAETGSEKLDRFRKRWVGACDGSSGVRVARLLEGL